jgi:hypothetical protein
MPVDRRLRLAAVWPATATVFLALFAWYTLAAHPQPANVRLVIAALCAAAFVVLYPVEFWLSGFVSSTPAARVPRYVRVVAGLASATTWFIYVGILTAADPEQVSWFALTFMPVLLFITGYAMRRFGPPGKPQA